MQSCETAWSLHSPGYTCPRWAIYSLQGMGRFLLVYCIDTCTKVMDTCERKNTSEPT